MQYNFPPINGYETFSIAEQVQKIKEEVQELEDALLDYQNLGSTSLNLFWVLVAEAFDVLQAIETLLRICEKWIDINDVKKWVKEKNRKRGYYDEGDNGCQIEDFNLKNEGDERR